MAPTVLFLFLMASVFALTVPFGSEQRQSLSVSGRLVDMIGQTATIEAVMVVGMSAPRCSESDRGAIHHLAAVSNYVQALGQISDGRLVCSTYVVQRASSVHGADSQGKSGGLTRAPVALTTDPVWKRVYGQKTLENAPSDSFTRAAAPTETPYPLWLK